MKNIYLLVIKTYYTDACGIEHYVADGDRLPYVYTSQSKAIKRAAHFVDLYCNLYGYKVTLSNEENPARKDDCIYASRIETVKDRYREEIRVYRQYTCD